MASYEAFIKSLRIHFEWTIKKDTKQLQYRDLTGPEKLILFKKIQISELLPNFDKSVDISNLWNDFITLIDALKVSYTSEEEINEYDQRVKKWIWISTFYIRLMMSLHICMHFPNILQSFCCCISMLIISVNRVWRSSKDYFRSTLSHKGNDALKQIMLKKQRVQLLEAMGCERVRRSCKCKNCLETEHSIKTCTNECKNCHVRICCTH